MTNNRNVYQNAKKFVKHKRVREKKQKLQYRKKEKKLIIDNNK